MKILVNPYFYIYITVLLFLIPLPWLTAWIISVFTHECGHWLAVRLCGEKIRTMRIGIAGAEMECGNLSTYKRLLCILCGPILGLLPVFFQRSIPKTAICCWMLSLYNLLPIFPFDGGRALHVIMTPYAFCCSQNVFLCIITAFSIYAAFFLNFGALPILMCIGLWINKRKIPCKQR